MRVSFCAYLGERDRRAQGLTQLDAEFGELTQFRREPWNRARAGKSHCLCVILEAASSVMKERTMNMSTIEAFTAGCASCSEAKARGISLVRCIWKGGERVFRGSATRKEAIAWLRIA